MKIIQVIGREIFDSRGFPTLECEIILEDEDGNLYEETASVPSGMSVGKYEALELRDGGNRLSGKGISQAIQNLEEKVAPVLFGKKPDIVSMDIKLIELDGTENKNNIGANTILSASLAILKAQARMNNMEPYEFIATLCDIDSVSLPFPMFNLINGGAHANNTLDIQEFLIIPTGQSSFRSAMESVAEVFYTLKKLLQKKGLLDVIGDEGGLAPNLNNEREALDLLVEAIEKTPNIEGDYVLGIDVAASRIYNSKTKKYKMSKKYYNSDELILFYDQLTKDYPIAYLEDGLDEDDWSGWKNLTNQLGKNLQIVGDDIFATNSERIWKGIEQQISNGVIIKPNQIGTVTEVLQAIIMCREHGLTPIISHRSGETNETLIVDLALGTQTMQIKAGGLTRGERLAKYNRLLTIEDRLTRSIMEKK